jgi:predicted secreted protein
MRRGDCAGRGTPELLTLKVNKATWVRQTTPAEGCPSGWALRDVYEDGRATLVVLAYHAPGFEGSNVAIAAFAGRR